MANTPKDKQLYVVLVWSAIPEVPRMYKFPADKPVAAMASTFLWSLDLLKLTCDDLIQRTTANLCQLASLYV